MKYLYPLILILFFTCETIAQEYPESYMCFRANDTIRVDGQLSVSEWGETKWTNYFVDIQGRDKQKPKHKTRVKMLWDDECFYIAAEIKEPHIWAKLHQRDTVIFYDNNFEVFIDPKGDNHMYYEIEVNALNTVWDLMLTKPYRDGGTAIGAWDVRGLKSAINIDGSLNDPSDKDKKWTIEIAIPWNVLKECATENRMPKSGEQWRVNFSRVNWDIEVVDDKYTKKINPKTGKVYPEHNWVWSPQGAVEMHQPETWGYVEFSDQKTGTTDLIPQKDMDYSVKMELIRLYNMEKKMYKKFGRYFNRISSEHPITIETTSRQFLISIKSNTGKTWFINQESKIWSE